MDKAKAVNDATLTKIGDIYQYNVALRDCFDLSDGETLLIETYGDISIISCTEKKFQREVKHHIDSGLLTDRNIDFWKTLANWYDDYERIKDFTQLILSTTADISSNSLFVDWNKLSKEDKIKTLVLIGLEKKEKEKLFRQQYDRIFSNNYDEDRLCDIVEKFTIESNCASADEIIKQFSKYISNIPNENRFPYVSALLGRILNKIMVPPHKWAITRADFEKLLQELAPLYIKQGNIPLPKDYAQATIPSAEEKTLQQKAFVDAIKEIQHDQMIPDAISDYWRTNLTIATFFKNDPIYLSSLDEYLESLEKRLGYTKSNYTLDYSIKSDWEQTIAAKKLYNEVMLWEPKNFGSIINNCDFFQHGVIHNLVDENKFRWKLGAEANEHK